MEKIASVLRAEPSLFSILGFSIEAIEASQAVESLRLEDAGAALWISLDPDRTKDRMATIRIGGKGVDFWSYGEDGAFHHQGGFETSDPAARHEIISEVTGINLRTLNNRQEEEPEEEAFSMAM
jgi:hypothetical protein